MSIKASAKSSGARKPSSSSMADSTTGGRARRCEVMCVSIYRGTASGGQIDKGFSGLRERANEGGRRKRSEKQISGQRLWENKKTKLQRGRAHFASTFILAPKARLGEPGSAVFGVKGREKPSGVAPPGGKG